MAERSHWWIERCLISLTLSLSFSDYLPTYLPIYFLCIYLSLYLAIYLSLSLFHLITLSIYLSLSLFHLSICLAVYLSIYLSIYLSLSLSSVYLSSCLCVCLSVCLSTCLPIYLSVCLPTYFWLHNVLRATTACTFSTSGLPKAVRTPSVLHILTSKCASRHNGVHFFDISTSKSGPRPPVFNTFDLEMCFRHNGVHFFDISTSKSGPKLRCFVHFDLEMCFAPQRRALFRHLNFQKWSAPLVFCPFWLGNVLRATTACTFSSLLWPAGSAPAALASLLFDPPEPQIIGKTQCFATFLPFRASVFLSSYSFSSDLLSSLCLCPALLFICPYCWKFDF